MLSNAVFEPKSPALLKSKQPPFLSFNCIFISPRASYDFGYLGCNFIDLFKSIKASE